MSTKKPEISIIIPTYGGSNSLKRSIESVLIQDFDSFEVIVVDDNNPGSVARMKTEKIMSLINDSRVIYIKHESNKNGAAARNTGIKNSKGAYITFLDDDDFYLQGKLSKQLKYFDLNPSGYGCYCWRQESNGKIVTSELEGDLSAQILSESFTPCTMTLMFKREVFDVLIGFDESYRRHQDYEFLLRYFKYFTLGIVKEVLVERSTNEIDNMPHGKKLLILKKKFLHQFKNDINNINKVKRGFKKVVYYRHYYYVFTDSVKNNHPIISIRVFFRLLFAHPLQFFKSTIQLIFKKKDSNE